MPTRAAQDLEAKAAGYEHSIASQGLSNGALDAAISGAELYMQALRLTDDPQGRARLDAKCRQLLAKAELIKAGQNEKSANRTHSVDMTQPVSTRKLTTRENIILLEDSKLNGAVFKPWTKPPLPTEFELQNGELYLESPPMSLSQDQLRSFDGWRRPDEALSRIQMTVDGVVLPTKPIMALPGKIDLVQDMASDCSVVASLCSGTARAERGHTRILGSIVYPYDFDGNHVKMSTNGRYVLRLYFNGCWRRVDIDDMLPSSNSPRVLHVVDRSHPGLLWPALIEKAYLKVRGGYDFPGSNSGTDLLVLTGWIPQQVFLHDEDVDANSLWTELFTAFELGNILLTIGTGKLPRREQKQLGLAAEHDYAILDMKMHGDVREMLIKNPWSDGDVWKGATKRRPNPNHEHEEPLTPSSEEAEEMLPGTFWMEFNSVFQYFENMYINWNPALFHHRHDTHFSWHISEVPFVPNIFVDNPQFCVRPSQSGEVWLQLNRHFRTGDYTHANSGKNGYISLYLYEKNGYRVLSTEGAKTRGPFVDSPNTLLRFEGYANKAYTVVVVSQELPPGKHNFTLSVFSQTTVNFQDTPSLYESQSSLMSAWTRSTSGGSSDSARYLQNPQFCMTISPRDTSAAIALYLTFDPARSLDKTDIHVKLLLLYSPAQTTRGASDLRAHRISSLRSRDVVATSGDYRRGSAVIETLLKPGTYTVICSTFDENQLAKFCIQLHTSSHAQAQLRSVPAESSGRLSIISAPANFEPRTTRLIAPITLPRITKAIFKINVPRSLQARSTSSSSLFMICIEQGQGPYKTTIATSAADGVDHASIVTGLRIEDVDLSPDLQAGGLWLVLERPAHTTGETQTLEVEALAEERIEIGEWRAVDA